MRLVPIFFVLSASLGVLAGPLGAHREAVEWFKARIPRESILGPGEVHPSRSYFYVGGRYVDAVSKNPRVGALS
jgi:hypothetical protein